MAQRKRAAVRVVKYRDRPYGLRWTNGHGETREESAGTRNRREAERLAEAKETALAKYDPDSRDIPWDVFRDRYEMEALPSLSKATYGIWTTSANRLERDMRPELLADVTKSLLSRWVMAMRTAGLADDSQRTYVNHVRAALSWAVEVDLLDFVPRVRLPRGQSRKMRSRAVTAAEFDAILATVPKVRPHDAERWRRFLLGLWHSGLRADELRRLSWDEHESLWLTDSAGVPLIRMLAAGHKARRDAFQPITPEFWALVKDDKRTGYVFPLADIGSARNQRGALVTVGQLSTKKTLSTISRFGEAAGVVTDAATGKFATSHDIGRRAFASRMDAKLTTSELQKWLRHASPETTMQFYHHKSAIELARKVGF